MFVPANDGKPVSDYRVIVFAEDTAHWGASSRFIAAAAADQKRGFTVDGHPPDRYLSPRPTTSRMASGSTRSISNVAPPRDEADARGRRAEDR